MFNSSFFVSFNRVVEFELKNIMKNTDIKWMYYYVVYYIILN